MLYFSWVVTIPASMYQQEPSHLMHIAATSRDVYIESVYDFHNYYTCTFRACRQHSLYRAHIRWDHSLCRPHIRWAHSLCRPHIRWAHSLCRPHIRWARSLCRPHIRWDHLPCRPHIRWDHSLCIGLISDGPTHCVDLISGGPTHCVDLISGGPTHCVDLISAPGISLSHCCHIFPWLCVWDGCTIIFCHLLHIYPGNTGTLFPLLMFSLWYLQMIGYIMACRSCPFVCRFHHLMIIIMQTYLKALNY